MTKFNTDFSFQNFSAYLETAEIDQTVGNYSSNRRCCVGAHLARYLKVEDDYNVGINAFYEVSGIRPIHARLMFKAVGLEIIPWGLSEWNIKPSEVFRRLAKIEALPETKNADLKNMNLSGLDLSNMDFSGADFTWANLSCVNLKKADLKNAKFKNTCLHGAEFQGANLYGANFKNCRASWADFRGAYIKNARFENVNFKRADLRDIHLENTCFISCDNDLFSEQQQQQEGKE